MLKHVLIIASTLMCVSQAFAAAGDWTGQSFQLNETQLGNYTAFPNNGSTSTISFQAPELCGFNPPLNNPSNCTNNQTGTIPLQEFATASSVDQVQTSINGLQASLNQSLGQMQATIQSLTAQSAQYAAMSAAMQTLAPTDGQKNRIGFNLGTAWGRQAVSASYVHTVGLIDLHVAGAVSSNLAMGQVGVGFSW